MPAAYGQGSPARSGSQLSSPASPTPACHPIATRRCGRTCSTKNSSLQPSKAHASCCVSAILGTGSTVTAPQVPDRRCGPQPARRPAELADRGGHDTALPFNRRWKGLPSRYSVSRPESRSASPASCTVCAFGRRSAMTSRLAGRVSSGTTLRDRRFVIASLDDLLCGRSPCRLPASVDGGHGAGGRPVAGAESLERLAATPARVRTQPVVRRRQPPVTGAPLTHRVEHPLGGPAALDRTRVAGLAVRVGVALAVARLRVRATAAARSDVAGLDRPRLRAGRVVEVRLDRRRRATEPVGDLPDREALELAVMPRQGDRPPTLDNPTVPALGALPVTPVTLPRSIGVSVALRMQVPGDLSGACHDDLLIRCAAASHPLPAPVKPLLAAPARSVTAGS